MALPACTVSRIVSIPHRISRAFPRLHRPKLVCRAAADDAADAARKLVTRPIDYEEIGKLIGSTVVETGIISAAFLAIDKVAGIMPDFVPAKLAVWLLLAGMSFRSQIVSPLKAMRPSTVDNKESKGFYDRKRPKWCPPAPVFGVVWTTISLLRATSGMMIWEACGRQMFVLPLLFYGFQLAIGDTWNYINNTQQRMGFAAVVVTSCVWTSAAAQVALYFQTLPAAGYTILPLSIWLTIATALVWGIWDLNGRQDLLPRVPIEDAAAASIADLVEEEAASLKK